MTLVSASIIKYLENFLTEAEISFIISDINKLEVYFPLNDKKNPKNYLSILVNVFIKYRVECFSIEDLSNQAILSFGSDFTSKIISDHNSSVEIIDFAYKVKSDLSSINGKAIKSFFQNIASSTPDIEKIDITSHDSTDTILNELLSTKKDSHDLGFSSYFKLNGLEDPNAKKKPSSKEISNFLSSSIEQCLRYYAYNMVFATWNYTYFTVYGKNFDLTTLSEIKKSYFVLEWFFTDSHSSRNFFHLQTAYNFNEWVDFCKTGVFNTFDKAIAYKLRFNETLVNKIKKLTTIITLKPFGNSENVFAPELKTILDYLQKINPLNDLSNLKSHEDLLGYYNTLEGLFRYFEMSFEAEKFRLQANQLLELLINKIVSQSSSQSNGIKFPFKLLWKKNDSLKSTVLYNNLTKESDIRFANFLGQFITSGINQKDFYDYQEEIDRLVLLQDKLTIIGDLPSNDKIALPEQITISFAEKFANDDELASIAIIDINVRRILSRCKKFWYKIVVTDNLYANDPTFKEFFDIEEKRETFAITEQLEKYLAKWNNYKSSSKIIHQLEEEIEIVSKLKFNIEGLRLVSRKFSGAMSFLNGKALMEKEKSRLIDAILKDLVGTQVSFHFNDGIKSNLDLIELSTSTNEKIISSAIQIVEQTQFFKRQILSILEPLPVESTIEEFIGLSKTLLGNTFKSIQITRFLENYNKWIHRLKDETQLLVVGLHIKNFNEFLVSLFGTISSTVNLISRFYKSSLTKMALVAINNISTTKNIDVFMSSLHSLNPLLKELISDLNHTLVHLHIYSEKLAEITEEVFSSYTQLVNTNEVISALKSINIKHTYENNILTVEEKITDKESLLKKQLFIEKAFRLSLLLNSVFVLVERKLNDEFKPLISNSSYNNLEEVGENVSLEDRIEIIRTILENIVEFLKSIKILSRRHTQVLKIIIYYAPILVDRLNIKESVKGIVFSILQKINNYNRHIKDFAILKDLNNDLIQFNSSFFKSFSSFLKIYIQNSDLRQQIEGLVPLESDEHIYSRNFLYWIKKIQLAVEFISEDYSELSLIQDLSTKFSHINLDAVQEEILAIFIARKDKEKLVFKRKDKVKKAALDKERSYQEEISSLQEKIRLLEDQLRALQEENQRLKELPPLERPSVFEPAGEVPEPAVAVEPEPLGIRLTELEQERLPTEDIFVKRNIEKQTMFSTKVTIDALIPAKSAEEVNPDIIQKIDPKPIEQDDELATLPEYDLIKELRKVGQARFMPLYRDAPAPDTDLIHEIESLIESQQVMNAGESSRPIEHELTANEELVEEVKRVRTKESESIFSFNLEEKIVPETSFRFKSPSEIVKFADKEKQQQEKSLDTMKSLKEEIAEYDEQPTALELKINAYARELFGEEEEEDVKNGSTNNRTNNKSADSEYDLINEMESLIDPTKKQPSKKKTDK